MDSDPENDKDSSEVAYLQSTLFQPTPRNHGSFFANFYLKPHFFEEENSSKDQRLSRDLSVLQSENKFIPQSPRWPTECQVLEEKVRHIAYVPPNPESYYTPTGKEPQSRPSGEECGIVVFQYSPISAVNYFSRSSVGGSRYLLPSCVCPEEDTLRFESRFESGNLAKAIKITPNYYELYLRADMYTSRHMQWFYFRVSNTKKNFLYRFSIINFTKEESLYNEGMRPLMYSTKDSHLHSIGWRRCGENITYYSNDDATPDDPDNRLTYTLSFTTEFSHDNDTVYFAHCYPYTYSDLEEYLTELSNHPIKSSFTTIRLLCKSLAGNNVHCVTITSPPIADEPKKKRSVVITSRVHPGETPSSWIMKGFLDYLTSDCNAAKDLRDKFIFKLVPMLNPDGVILGNNRCSLSAKDLNRQYRTVMRDVYPSIWYTKLMVRRLLEECGVAMYCDLHAHSRKHNIFVYGCENRRITERKLQEQVFPLMLHKNTADKFSFESCKFRVQKSKEGTGRVVMWMMGIPNSYTMECSFAGSTTGTRTDTHFSTQDYEAMAKSFCQTLLDYYDDNPKKEKLRIKITNRLVEKGSNADEPTNIHLSDYSSDEADTSSCNSNEVDLPTEIIFPAAPPPSPIVFKKFKPKVYNTITKNLPKNYNIVRKSLPICKTTLGLSVSDKEIKYTSYSSSDEEEYKINKKQTRKKIRKKTGLKKRMDTVSDCEIQQKISLFELIPRERLHSNGKKRSKTPQKRSEKKNFLSQQFSEVHAKLLILKKQLWFGVGNAENAALSWGRSQFNLSTGIQSSPKNCRKKRMPILKKSKTKPERQIVAGLTRQSAVKWDANDMEPPKFKCLANSIVKAFSCDEDGMQDKKKKKKKSYSRK